MIALNEFDLQLKSLFYPKVMFIETALKNYVIEAVLNNSKSENFDVIFNNSVTCYRDFTKGSRNYNQAYTKRMKLKGKINSILLRDYGMNQQIVKHFFDSDKAIPIWAIFESLALGEFGTFFSCCNTDTKLYTSALLKLPTNLDADGAITEFIIYTIKDLRNAIAHNNVIFDTRFQTGRINSRLMSCLEHETKIPNIMFSNIDSYVILIVYVLRKMGTSKTECRKFLRNFISITESLRHKIPINMYNQIIYTNLRPNMNRLDLYISNS